METKKIKIAVTDEEGTLLDFICLTVPKSHRAVHVGTSDERSIEDVKFTDVLNFKLLLIGK